MSSIPGCASTSTHSLAGTDLLSIQDLEKRELLLILEQAARLQGDDRAGAGSALLAGRVLAPLFYHPAPWFRSSFESAMARLGGHVLSMAGFADARWAQNGNDLAQTAEIASAYADVIVHRHPEVYSAHEAAKGARVPLINAGDGTYERPAQALVDLYTIREEKGAIDGLTITIVGNLRHSAVVHSLARALAHWDVMLYLVSPASLKMSGFVTVALRRTVTVIETEDLDSAMEVSDVLYVAPGEDARFAHKAAAERLKEGYRIDRQRIQRVGSDLTLMQPLPTGGEIPSDVDSLPGTACYRQAVNGVWVRMALLALLLGAL
jgi:aspartate carbamoyltransferase catalytic subunit